MVETIKGVAQSAWPGAAVELFVLDATSIGGGMYRFVNGTLDGAVVKYGTHPYTPFPVTAEGFAWSGDGERPTPTLKIGNDGVTVIPLLIAFDHLRGCSVTRIRTFDRFLDGQPDADPGAHWGVDVYAIDRCAWNKTEVTFDLRSQTDVRGRRLPRRQAVREYCDNVYRRWDPAANGGAGGYDYTGVTCPYTGSGAFDTAGNSVAAASDQCSKLRGSGCKLRFGSAALPFRGFPGLAKAR